MTKTKTIEHKYGTEVIEVDECSSCGQEAKVQKMREFRIYDNQCEDYLSGCICQNCRDLETPVQYPTPHHSRKELVLGYLGVSIGICIIIFVLFVSLLLVTEIIELILNLIGI